MSRKESKRNGRQANHRITILLMTVLMITIGSIVFGSTFSNAHDNISEASVEYKYYKSIVIKDGDTLWDIAREYKNDEYASTQEYIDELKQLNSLQSDVIQEDQHLLVAYYDSELR